MTNPAGSDVYGIDLGTTFTSIAHVGGDMLGRVEVLKIGDDGDMIESVVYLREEENRLRAWVGSRARDEHKAFEEKGRFVAIAKRYIGIDGPGAPGWPVRIGGLALRPHHVSSLVLRKVAQEVSRLRPGEPVLRVVITHPHYFPDPMKEATREAGRLAGLTVIDTLNEPSAAIIAYGVLNRDEPGHYLVFDLGGGTFDVTLVDVQRHHIRVIGGGGDPRLGGTEWDNRLLDHFNNEFRKTHPAFDLYARSSEQTIHEWREAAVRIKHQLSSSDVARARLTADIDGEPAKAAVELTRSAFEGMTAHLVTRCKILCEEVLERHRIGFKDLRDVLMVGGSTKMHMVRKMVAQELGRPPRTEGFDPSTIVAQGAAYYGRYYAGERPLFESDEPSASQKVANDPRPSGLVIPEVTDALARGFGVGAYRGDRLEVDVLVPADTPTPAHREHIYQTMRDGQTEIHVPLYEGESRVPEACTHIGTVILRNIPPRPRGQDVRVVFDVERSGRKRVFIADLGTGRSTEQLIERSTFVDRTQKDIRETLMTIEVV